MLKEQDAKDRVLLQECAVRDIKADLRCLDGLIDRL